MKKLFFVLFYISCSVISFSQSIKDKIENPTKIEIPDIPGYFTMKCDFHMHTVFSDGKVWPDIRVHEAIAEGLDAIAITDHVEYHRDGVEDNHTIGDGIAEKAAEGKELVLVKGGEMSASHDHYNALFLTNQDDPILRDENPAVRIKGANDQGAFVFWNHPGWTKKYKDGNFPATGELIPLLKNGQVKGIEICNGMGYWEGAHKTALENNITLLGNSDIHGPSYYQFDSENHRTVTLVFAKEKSVNGIREALLNQRTAIYRGNDLIGSEEFLKPLFLQSVEIKASYRKGTSVAVVELVNNSDIDFMCDYTGEFGLYNSFGFITIAAHATTTVMVKTIEVVDSFPMGFIVHNAITAPGQKLKVGFTVSIESTE
jgi:3',5'-nucleoside bisphosphate phosphatase